MIETFASASRDVQSDFLDLNHPGRSLMLAALSHPKLAPEASIALRRPSDAGR
jgi:hypothetical protein